MRTRITKRIKARDKNRQRRAENPELLIIQRDYMRKKRAEHPELAVKMRKYSKKWAKKHPEKTLCHTLWRIFARKMGVVKPVFCEKCGLPIETLEAHHEDYTKPFEVQWLCYECHGKTRNTAI